MKPTILIEDEVYRKVMHWVNKSQFEVSGLGMVKIEADGVLRVVSAMLLPQKNGTGHTDIEAEDVCKAMYQLRNSEGELRWWWHSHVQMGVFWSTTDLDTIKKLGEQGWFINTVFNQKKEVKSCYYSAQGQQTPWGVQPLMVDDLTTKLQIIDDPMAAEWDREYNELVTIKRFQPQVYSGGNEWGKSGGVMSPNTASGSVYKYDPTQRPPAEKPPGMSKNVYKKWGKSHAAYEKARGAAEVANDVNQALKNAGLDEYGFTQDERTLLAQEGWSLDDVDTLLKEDICPSEMLRMAKLQVSPSEVRYLIHALNYRAEDVTEILENSEAFGENLFNSPSLWRSHVAE